MSWGRPVTSQQDYMSANENEPAGSLQLPLGGKHGFLGVRGRQGRYKDKFQGCTPRKTHRTKHCKSAREAAIEFAQLKQKLKLDVDESKSTRAAKKQRSVVHLQGMR